MFWNLKEDSVKIGDNKLNYAVFGKGETPFVIIPGLTLRDVKGAGAGLAVMYRRFSRNYRVYVLDKKAEIPEDYTVADLANDAAEAMIALGIKNACVLGVSLGGMIAQELAIRHPELVQKLVLGVTASRTNDTVNTVVNNWIGLAEKDDFGGIVRDMLTVMYSEKYVKRYGWLFPILAKFARPKNKDRFIRLAKACLTCEAYERLTDITCPTLVLGGSDDKIVTGEASIEIAERIGCDIHMYEKLGHSAYEEAKDFNTRIQNFFENTL